MFFKSLFSPRSTAAAAAAELKVLISERRALRIQSGHFTLILPPLKTKHLTNGISGTHTGWVSWAMSKTIRSIHSITMWGLFFFFSFFLCSSWPIPVGAQCHQVAATGTAAHGASVHPCMTSWHNKLYTTVQFHLHCCETSLANCSFIHL